MPARWRSTRTMPATRATSCARIGEQARSGWRELTFNRSFQDRLGGVGVLTADDVARLGATGPAARAAGVAEDVRGTHPRPASRPCIPEHPTGDVAARLEQRALELWQSLGYLDEALGRPVEPAAAGRGRRSAAARRRSCREPARRDDLHRRLSRGASCASGCARARTPTGRGRPRRRRQPAARLPARQQELRALLRLRGPLAPCWPCSATSAGCAATSACRAPPGAAAWPCATSTPARATAASTS